MIELEDNPKLSAEGFTRLARFVTGEVGIQMPAHKVTLLESRLLRRTRELGFASVEEYANFALETPDRAEREHLINAITTNKTDFFREPDHFDHLVGAAIPAWAAARRHGPGARLNVWSAGCSSGEEPYTLAMVLSEYAASHSGFAFAILGTDVSTRVLDKARNGVYSEAQVLPVPERFRRSCFWHSRNIVEPLVRIVPSLRRTVSFHRLNLMDSSYPIRDTFDVVFFRNVMIYFDRKTQEAVVRRLCAHLSPGGYLFVGHSESLSGLDCGLDTVHPAVFRKPVH